jgi:hypothetical protein
MGKSGSSQRLYGSSPYLSKLESIASSAVRAADKVQASLIVVYTHTGGDRQEGRAGCRGRCSGAMWDLGRREGMFVLCTRHPGIRAGWRVEEGALLWLPWLMVY